MANIPTAKAPPVKARSPKGWRYHAIRFPNEMLERLHELKEAETLKVGYPVSIAALCRKFIVEAMDRYTRGTRTV